MTKPRVTTAEQDRDNAAWFEDLRKLGTVQSRARATTHPHPPTDQERRQMSSATLATLNNTLKASARLWPGSQPADDHATAPYAASAYLGNTGIRQHASYSRNSGRDHAQPHRAASPDHWPAHLPAGHLPGAALPVIAVLRCDDQAAYAPSVGSRSAQLASATVTRATLARCNGLGAAISGRPLPYQRVCTVPAVSVGGAP